MGFSPEDRYLHGTSPAHRMDPRVKLVSALLVIIGFALMPDRALPIYPILIGIVFSLAVLAEIGILYLIRRSLVALPFALAAITLAFTVPGNEVWSPWPGLSVTDAGLMRFAAVMLKSWLSVQVALVLAVTTHFTDMLWALSALHMPQALVAIISFMYRYLFVLGDEAARMMRAREARSAYPDGHGGGSIAWRAKVTGTMIGSLFLRSYERSERVYQAMVARGYDGKMRTLSPPKLTPNSLLIGAVPVTLVLALSLAAHLIWY